MSFTSLLAKLFGNKKPSTQETTAVDTFRISQPIIGFMNLLSDAGKLLVDSDHARLAPLFTSALVSDGAVPRCHVLFLYCHIDSEGQIRGSQSRLRDIIKAAGAYVAVVAAENNPDHCFSAVEPENDWPANIVLVLDRKGAIFGTFFSRLFQAMSKGQSMLMAWVELAPQMPGHQHPDCPISILLPEAGHITLDGSSS